MYCVYPREWEEEGGNGAPGGPVSRFPFSGSVEDRVGARTRLGVTEYGSRGRLPFRRSVSRSEGSAGDPEGSAPGVGVWLERD